LVESVGLEINKQTNLINAIITENSIVNMKLLESMPIGEYYAQLSALIAANEAKSEAIEKASKG